MSTTERTSTRPYERPKVNRNSKALCIFSRANVFKHKAKNSMCFQNPRYGNKGNLKCSFRSRVPRFISAVSNTNIVQYNVPVPRLHPGRTLIFQATGNSSKPLSPFIPTKCQKLRSKGESRVDCVPLDLFPVRTSSFALSLELKESELESFYSVNK